MIGTGMRGGDDVRHAIGDGHFGHGHGHIERFSAVIEGRENVAVNVDHVKSSIAQGPEDHNETDRLASAIVYFRRSGTWLPEAPAGRARTCYSEYLWPLRGGGVEIAKCQ